MRIVLAYSGGLQMSASIPWLAATYNAEVITVTLDLGVGAELEAIRDRALSLGAARAHVLDVREEFARGFLVRALSADAMNDGYPMLSALSQPLLGRKLIEIARLEEAGLLAHGCLGEDLDRLEAIVQTLDPKIRILAPARDRHATEAETVGQLRALGVSARSPRVERVSRHAADCPDEAAFVEVTFEKGVPTAMNGIPMPLVELLDNLGMIAAAHGVRRSETAAAAAAFVLHVAHRELQCLTTTDDVNRFARTVSEQYAQIVRSGAWFTLFREALDAFVEKIQERVDGTVRLQLFKGECRRAEAPERHAATDSSATVALARA
jgi:argininosuccinate synthase